MQHGTPGERALQTRQQSKSRAERFYDRQMGNRITDKMTELIGHQEMVFVATADAEGNCDCSPRFGSRGFVHVVDSQTLAYPEYRGNGVFASLGNMEENPHVGLVFVDFCGSTVGLHVNGSSASFRPEDIPESLADYLTRESPQFDSEIECWVVIRVDEAYIHCSKHVPRMLMMGKPIEWGTDDPAAKSEDYFEDDGV